MCVCLCVCFKVISVASFVIFIAFCSLSLALFVKFRAIYYHSFYLCFLNDTNFVNFVEWGLNSKVFVETVLIDLYSICREIGNARKVFDEMEGKHRKLFPHKGKTFYVPPPYYNSLYLCFLNDSNFMKFRAMKI
ncbi:hypothetical protein AMTRI_Chr04g246690 [Amborella trichopoda]